MTRAMMVREQRLYCHEAHKRSPMMKVANVEGNPQNSMKFWDNVAMVPKGVQGA
jgi:hypothetical protein